MNLFKRVPGANYFTFLAIILCVITSQTYAQDINRLDKIGTSGKLIVGTRLGSLPFSDMSESGEFYGFSIDIARLLARGISKKIGKDLDVQFVPVTTKNRFDLVAEGGVDLVCGLTTINWQREQRVDFSIPFFVDGNRILVKKNAQSSSLASLKGKKIGVVAETTTLSILEANVPGVVVEEYENLDTAMEEFLKGNITGVANIGAFLARKRAENSGKYTMELLPKKMSLGTDIIACILPENDSDFSDTVNNALWSSYEGIEEYLGEYAEIYFSWFGKQSEIQFPMTDEHRSYLRYSKIWQN
jgi:polar amino acid transport system substrate-binding protein